MEGEEQVLNHPPLFKGQNYEMWKMRMMDFIEYNNMELINIMNGIQIVIEK